jgi:hypothetical protein
MMPEVQYERGGQGRQTDAPANEYTPVAAHAVHATLLPGTPLKVPAAHMAHTVRPVVSPNMPTGQGVATDMPMDGQYEPAGQMYDDNDDMPGLGQMYEMGHVR